MATRTVICDTDVIIDYWDNTKARHSATKYIINDVIGLDNVSISAITQIELLIGSVNKRELLKIKQNLQRFNILSIDNMTTEKAIQLITDYTLSHGLALPDALVAATSIIVGESLFTYNVRDYKFITGLKLYEPINE